MEQNYWRKCSVCKTEIPFSHRYYVCSVSSCNKKRSPNQFCTVKCWDVHRSVLNHMSAGADEETSPSKESWQSENSEERTRRRIVASKPTSSNEEDFSSGDIPKDVLVVVSKLKAYIKAKSGMNTSADVMPVLSQLIRQHCDEAIAKARQSERKTVMARDF